MEPPSDLSDGFVKMIETRDRRIAALEAALCDLYNECMAYGWNTRPMTDAMQAARTLLQSALDN